MRYRFSISKSALSLILLAAAIIVALGAVSEQRTIIREPVWGATFSPSHAEYLGLDWLQTYQALSDELGIKHFRIPINWNRAEPEKNNYEIEWLDKLILEAEKRGDELTFVVGQKVPRWPECHFPDWVKKLNDEEREEAALDMVRVIVERYKWSPSVAAWQIENEPQFPFGQCPKISSDYLKKEAALVRTLDPERSLILTDSGELGDWMRAAKHADILGVSLYRETWNSILGQMFYPQGPDFYRRRAWAFVPKYVKGVFISELQVEPWKGGGIMSMFSDEQGAEMSPELVQEHLNYARATHFPKVYLWGVEWWYLMKLKGDDRFWEIGEGLF